jgi:hypothetical protein
MVSYQEGNTEQEKIMVTSSIKNNGSAGKKFPYHKKSTAQQLKEGRPHVANISMK